MITLFTGTPGAGKTAAMVDYLSKLAGDRPVYVDGLNGLTLPHTPCDASKWHHELPEGAILVIDEVQRVWRPRGSGSKVPDEVAALETHRHRGIDVLLTTQAPTLLDANVRNLVGRHVHIRDTGILGRYWYEWPEISTSMSWKTCVNKRSYKLPKKAFSLYKSSSLHTEPVRGIPRAIYYGAAVFVVLAVLLFMVYKIIGKGQNGGNPDVHPLPVSQNVQTVSHIPSKPGSTIDDRVDFIPRVSSKPESAPAYDHLRQIVAMPVVVGGVCVGSSCKCITQQGTNSGLSSAECKAWMENVPFDNYRRPPEINGVGGVASAGTQHPANRAGASPSIAESLSPSAVGGEVVNRL